MLFFKGTQIKSVSEISGSISCGFPENTDEIALGTESQTVADPGIGII